jgi:hypothetical protein
MAERTYECIPEGKGWIVINLVTSKPAVLDGAELVDLRFDEADEIAKLLNSVNAVLNGATKRDETTGS